MGKDSGSCLRPHPPDGLPLNETPSTLPLNLGLQEDPSVNMYATAGIHWAADSKLDQVREPQCWLYYLHCYRRGLSHNANMVLHEKIPMDANSVFERPTDASTPNLVPGCASKRFLVFDQTEDKTTMILGPGIGTSVQCPTSWTPKPNVGCFSAEELGIRTDTDHSPFGPNLTEELNDEEHGTDEGSDMREDTEEINALLYSDDECDYAKEEDEETSTGHSPSAMTGYEKQAGCFVGEQGTEEVASSVGPMKRQKLSNGVCQMPLLCDTVSSLKRESSAEYQDDAQSSCVGGEILKSNDVLSSISGKKRSRAEKIRETVNMLQNIIPGGKGKGAIMIIDEAIHYLRSLKSKAESLVLSSP